MKFGIQASSTCVRAYVGLGSIRFNFQGERLVLACEFAHLHEVLGKPGFENFYDEKMPKVTLSEWLNCGSIDSTFHFKRCLVKPGSVLVVPPGWAIMEKTLNRTNSVGYRTSFVLPSQKSMFMSLSETMVSTDPDNKLNATMSKLAVLYDKAAPAAVEHEKIVGSEKTGTGDSAAEALEPKKTLTGLLETGQAVQYYKIGDGVTEWEDATVVSFDAEKKAYTIKDGDDEIPGVKEDYIRSCAA